MSKRSIKCFLAFILIFTSCSLLSCARPPQQPALDRLVGVQQFLSSQLKISSDRLEVKQLTGGRSGIPVFSIKVDGKNRWVFKIFNSLKEVALEKLYLQMIHDKKFKNLTTVDGLRTWRITDGKDKHAALLINWVPGLNIGTLFSSLALSGKERQEGLEDIVKFVRSTARAMAELHNGFLSGNKIDPKTLQAESQYILSKLDHKVRPKLGWNQYNRIRRALVKQLIPSFDQSELQATVVHGDANVGNFLVDRQSNKVYVIDVGSFRWSFDDAGNPIRTSAVDVARYIQSLASYHTDKLSHFEINRLQQAFEDEYFRHANESKQSLKSAIKLYRIDFEFAVILHSKDDHQIRESLKRILNLLRIDEPAFDIKQIIYLRAA